ncbi:DUF2935 domain-containing protein [Aneurinibacillus soli]|uniref:DUF2935 domain-containing protein n=1 Tax=Aneurinibacillus soli TaxID=1500254 RepID=UPI000BBA8AAF|nr:DUF2935 domain-containing protein [Aneurinibacillus soli]
MIRALVPNLEPAFVQALQAWEQAFSQTHALFVRYIEIVSGSGYHISPMIYNEIMHLVHFALQQSQQFVQFLNQLAAESAALKSNPTAITVLNHIRRESEYFIGVSEALLQKSR